MRKSPKVALKGSYRRNKVLLRNLNNTSICEDRDRQTGSGKKGERLEILWNELVKVARS